ncbi:NAD-dependent malic enzyme, partial [Lactococcus lactis]
MVDFNKVLDLHELHTGVLDIQADIDVKKPSDLAEAYTPGVAELSKLIQSDPEAKRKYTMSGKLVAVVTDGTAVLGLGNMGPAGGLPIVEGKA